jgi:hypothetical protein
MRSDKEAASALKELTERVDLSREGFRLSLKLLLLPAGTGGRASTDHLSLNKIVPIQMKRRGVEMEWSFVLDALQAERDQAVTIDTTRIWFAHAGRKYAIIDAPGHRQFVANMLSGASEADAAVLMVDVTEGVSDIGLRRVEHDVDHHPHDRLDGDKVIRGNDLASINPLVRLIDRDGFPSSGRCMAPPFHGQEF